MYFFCYFNCYYGIIILILEGWYYDVFYVIYILYLYNYKVKEKLLSIADEESYFNLDALSLQENNFYITSKGLTFTWGIYEIAPYATGDSEVLFSIDEIMPYLKDEYKNIFE